VVLVALKFLVLDTCACNKRSSYFAHAQSKHTRAQIKWNGIGGHGIICEWKQFSCDCWRWDSAPKKMIEIFDTKRNDNNLLNCWSKKRYCRCQSATTKFRTAVLQIESRAVFNVGNLYHLHVFELKNSRLTVPFCGPHWPLNLDFLLFQFFEKS